jgi:outer membrane protein TolC
MFERAPKRIGLMFLSLAASFPALGGCQWFVNDADQQVYHLIETRQQQALGETRPAPIDQERVPVAVGKDAYDFVPNPLDMPGRPSFRRDENRSSTTATRPSTVGATNKAYPVSSGGPAAATQPTSQEEALTPAQALDAEAAAPESRPENEVASSQPSDATATAQTENRPELSLSDALQYAFTHSREYEFAKEDLYLTALALTLERHLWNPRFFSDIQSQYANYGEVRDFDHAMEAVAEAGVRQRLPLGGEVTARVVDTLMRDLTNHVTTAETGQVILEANLPLLRGAGLVAMETRFQAERNLIYAVRTFERFRHSLAVDIASDYFSLQDDRQAIVNAHESMKSYAQEVARARGLWEAGRILKLEVERAEQNRLRALNSEVDAREQYETALDAFKIRIGMPTDQAFDVSFPPDPSAAPAPGQNILSAPTIEEALQLPAVTEQEAIRVAFKYRLDLLNFFDQIDDAARGITVAENNLLPDLNASGSATMSSDPARLNAWRYNTDRTTWRGFLNLEIPLDRVAERNALRTSLIRKRRAERTYDEARENVRLQVRRALRRVEQEQSSLEINLKNRDLALVRLRGARIQFDKGLVSNREITDALNELLDARNRLAQSQSLVRVAILQFLRDTETLRIDENGQWAPSGGTARRVASEPENG